MVFKYFNPETEPLIIGLSDQFMSRLDDARMFAGVPFVITSALRSPEQNAALKGAVSDSAHLPDAQGQGHAVDLSVEDDGDLFCMILGLVKAGFRRIGIYVTRCEDNHNRLIPRHIHVDDDVKKPLDVLWLLMEQN